MAPRSSERIDSEEMLLNPPFKKERKDIPNAPLGSPDIVIVKLHAKSFASGTQALPAEQPTPRGRAWAQV